MPIRIYFSVWQSRRFDPGLQPRLLPLARLRRSSLAKCPRYSARLFNLLKILSISLVARICLCHQPAPLGISSPLFHHMFRKQALPVRTSPLPPSKISPLPLFACHQPAKRTPLERINHHTPKNYRQPGKKSAPQARFIATSESRKAPWQKALPS